MNKICPDEVDDKDIAQRRDDALKRALSTPPKPKSSVTPKRPKSQQKPRAKDSKVSS